MEEEEEFSSVGPRRSGQMQAKHALVPLGVALRQLWNPPASRRPTAPRTAVRGAVGRLEAGGFHNCRNATPRGTRACFACICPDLRGPTELNSSSSSIPSPHR